MQEDWFLLVSNADGARGSVTLSYDAIPINCFGTNADMPYLVFTVLII